MNNMFKKEIGNRLRIARENAGLKQDDVAKVIGSTFQKVSSFETGRTRVDLETLVILCDLYKTNTDYILNPELNRTSPGHNPVGTRKDDRLIKLWRQLPHKAQQEMLLKIEAKLEECATSEDQEGSIKSAQG